MRIAMTIEYDGGPYFGFQRQKEQTSVQAELERALSVVLRQTVRVWCAGRTDTGVNALGQVVHFVAPPGLQLLPSTPAPVDRSRASSALSLDRLIYALNSLLPRDIAIRQAAAVPENFHARFSCLAREYVYLIYNAPYRPGTLGFKSLWLREKLEWDLVRSAIPYLLGENNFAAFTKVALVKAGERTIRRIDAIDVVNDGAYNYVWIRGSGFLHNMIRILVGTLLDVARGKIAADKVAEIVASADRLEAGVTLKPHALYFLYAHYGDYDQAQAEHPLRRMMRGHVLANEKASGNA